MPGNQSFLWIVVAMVLLIWLATVAFVAMLIRPWLRAFLSGVPVSMFDVLAMRLRGNPPGLLIDTLLVLKHRGVEASMADIESTYLANKGQVHQPARLAGMVEERLRNRTAGKTSMADRFKAAGAQLEGTTSSGEGEGR
jgi:uncharacterized protein YqfA (UPF0365 family)